ncbi:hypothetical protein Vafri_21990, partial [Volvox africanus]
MGFMSCFCFRKNEEPCLLSPAEVGLEVSQAAATSTYASAFPCQIDVSLLKSLQLALAVLEGDGFAGRATRLTSTVKEYLGQYSIVRLYGLTADDHDPHIRHLVQLAATAGQGVTWSRHNDEIRPGRSLTLLPSPASSTGLPSSSVLLSGIQPCVGGEVHTSLLEVAACSKEPAIYQVGSLSAPTKDGTSALTTWDPSGSIPALPRDCAEELNAMIGYPRMGIFAAVPLVYGERLIGALWIAIVVPNATAAIDVNSQLRCVGSAPSDPASPAKGSWLEQAARSQTLLGNTAALGQLGVSTSMALALAAGGDIDYISWLATCVRSLASCATLHTLIAGVCSILSKHVRLRFHADVAVQTALVPEADSTVAFMLCPETKPAGGGPVPGGAPCSRLLNRAASYGRRTAADPSKAGAALSERARQPAGGDLNPGSASAPRNCATCKPTRMPVHRALSQGLLQPDSDTIAIDTSCGTNFASHSATSTTSATTAAVTTIDTSQPQGTGTGGGGLSTAHSPASQHGRRSRDRTADPADGSYATRAARSPAGPTSATSAPVLYMSAKAFQLSQTLLSRLVSNAVAHRSPLKVPVGVIVPDTARHVADVRQPS